jgi:hypothetical protein
MLITSNKQCSSFSPLRRGSFYFFLFLMFCSINCTKKETIVSPSEPSQTNPGLLGVWYHVYYDTWPWPGPPILSAFELTPDSNWNDLTMNLNTGNLQVMSTTYKDSLLQINSKEVFLDKYTYPAGYGVDTIPYSFVGDTLKIFATDFHKTNFDSVILGPVPTTFNAKVNGTSIVAPQLGNYPSVFVSNEPADSYCNICGFLGNGIQFYIGIHLFQGEGEYTLGGVPNTGSYGNLYWYVGNTLVETITDSTHTGKIIIDHYDQTTHRCSGSFEFHATNVSWQPTPAVDIYVTDGIFDLQVYE